MSIGKYHRADGAVDDVMPTTSSRQPRRRQRAVDVVIDVEMFSFFILVTFLHLKRFLKVFKRF